MIITTEDVPGKYKQCILNHMENLLVHGAQSASSTIPPTHSLINAHHLCTKFNFVLLIVPQNLDR